MTPLDAMKKVAEVLLSKAWDEEQYCIDPDLSDAYDSLSSAITEMESAEPMAEWVLVPRVYTGEMAHAAFMAGDSNTIPNRFYMRLAEWWEAMLAAAPKHPAQSRDSIIEECIKTYIQQTTKDNITVDFVEALRALKGK